VDSSNETTSLRQVVVRMFWMMLGPGVLALLLFNIAGQGKGWLATSSIAFLVVLGGVILARSFDPRNSFGEPSTTADFRRYAVGALGLGVAAWALANLLGIHWWGV
jgi:hypothetical protein